MKKNAGAVLIELMIVVILELILVGIIVEIYSNAESNYQLQIKLNDIQSSGTAAINIISEEIHKAGKSGCQRLNHFLMQNSLSGNDSELTVRHVGESSTLLETMQHTNILYVSNEAKFSPSDIVLIANCQHFEIFKIATVTRTSNYQKITSFHPLRVFFKKNSELGKLEVNRFFVAKTSQQFTDKKYVHALFFENIKGEKYSLVDGIHKMHIKYIVLQENRLVELTSAQINDWTKVKGVAIQFELAQDSIHKTWYCYISLEA